MDINRDSDHKCLDFLRYLYLKFLFTMDTGATSDQQVPLLIGDEDSYNGLTVNPSCLPSDPEQFVRSLRKSLQFWKSKGLRGIWLKLPKENSNLVHPAIQEGFDYHHAEKQYVMLATWLPETISTLPANASHIVGLGALVINDNDEILVVQEITGPTKGSGVWKMPTGVVQMGEDIKDAVVREVEEETHVKCEFVEVLGIRQAHGAAFGKSDLFFACLLRPLSAELVTQQTEIAAVKWMPLDEFRNQPFNSKSEVLTRIVDMIVAHKQEKYHGFGADFLYFGFRKRGSYFYHNVNEIKAFLDENK